MQSYLYAKALTCSFAIAISCDASSPLYLRYVSVFRPSGNRTHKRSVKNRQHARTHALEISCALLHLASSESNVFLPGKTVMYFILLHFVGKRSGVARFQRALAGAIAPQKSKAKAEVLARYPGKAIFREMH